MPRTIERIGKPLSISPSKLSLLADYLHQEIEDALSSRKPLESMWQTLLRQYEGVPKDEVRNFPVENAPNIEVTLGAIAADSLYAQMIDLIFSAASPLITVRSVPKRKRDEEAALSAKALQRFANWLAANEVSLRPAVEEAGLDDTQLGTACYYIPWTESIVKRRTAKVTTRSPKIRCIPVEDFVVPAGSFPNTEEMPWVALRFWPTTVELNERSLRLGWDISSAQVAGAKDWVRSRREALGRQQEGIQRKGDVYEILDVYVYFDIDDDGFREDLYCVYDRTSRSILYCSYNPYDRRPIEYFVYQRRAHLAYGIGILQMMRPYQEEITDLHNWQVLNALLANCRLWVGKTGQIPDNMRIWPNRVINVPNPREDLHALQMADVYPSLQYIQFAVTQLAERRVGMTELSPLPRTGGQGGFGTRTPGITALSLMQQASKRFTPAFDGIKNATARALVQCLYRYQERLLAKDHTVEEHIFSILGDEDGERVVSLLSRDSFDEHIEVELTAASAQINREADRQASIMLMNMLTQYYQSVFQLASVITSGQAPEPLKNIILQISESAKEAVERVLRTFDQVRDPALFLIDLEAAVGEAAGQLSPEALPQLLGMFGQLPPPAEIGGQA